MTKLSIFQTKLDQKKSPKTPDPGLYPDPFPDLLGQGPETVGPGPETLLATRTIPEPGIVLGPGTILGARTVPGLGTIPRPGTLPGPGI